MASYLPYINYDQCYGCKACLYNCPVSLFTLAKKVTRRGMRRELPATTYIERCIGCGVCARMCPVEAIEMLKNPPGEGDPVYIDWDKPVRIDPNKCKGCTSCARNCPASAIEGKVKEPHVIHEDQCIRCGLCIEKCKFDAIYNSDAPVPEYVAPEPKKEAPAPAAAPAAPVEATPAASEAVADTTPAAAAPQEKIEGKYSIDPEKCKGCTACAKACPAEAISGEVKQPHVIDQEACLGCGACADTCKFGAISQN